MTNLNISHKKAENFIDLGLIFFTIHKKRGCPFETPLFLCLMAILFFAFVVYFFVFDI